MRYFQKLVFLALTMFMVLNSFAQLKEEEKVLPKVQELKQEGHFEEAIYLLRPLYEKSPFDQNLYHELLELYRNAKNYKEAHELIDYMQKIRREDKVVWVDKALLYFEENKKKEGQIWMDSIMNNLPNNKIALEQIANKFQKNEKYLEAIEVYEKGRVLRRVDWLFASELMHASLELGDLERATSYALDMIWVPRNQIEDVQEAMVRILDMDEKKGERILKREIRKRIKEEPTNYRWNELWNWFLLTQGSHENAVKAMIDLDKSLEEEGQRLLPMAHHFIRSKEFGWAYKLLDEIEKKGKNTAVYNLAKIAYLNALLDEYAYLYPQKEKDSVIIKNRFQEFLKDNPEYKEQDLYRRYIRFEVDYLKNIKWALKEVESFVEKLKFSNNKELYLQAKLDWADYLIYDGQVWEATLILGQIDKEDPQGSYGEWSRFKNAELAFYRGDFTWALEVLNILKASTTNYIANDAIDLSVLISENNDTKIKRDALKALAAIKLKNKRFLQKEVLAEIQELRNTGQHKTLEDYYLWEEYLAHKQMGAWGNAKKALKLLLEHQKESVLADEATFYLAELYEQQSNDPEKALFYYEELLLNYPSSTFVIHSRNAIARLQRLHKNL